MKRNDARIKNLSMRDHELQSNINNLTAFAFSNSKNIDIIAVRFLTFYYFEILRRKLITFLLRNHWLVALLLLQHAWNISCMAKEKMERIE